MGGWVWRHKYFLCFREGSRSVLKHFSTKPPTLSQIPLTTARCICEVFGAFSSLPHFSPLEVAKKETTVSPGCEAIVLQLISPNHPSFSLTMLREQSLHIFLQGELEVQSRYWKLKNQLENIWFVQLESRITTRPEWGRCKGFSHLAGVACYQICLWKWQIIKGIKAKPLLEKFCFTDW